ncbi:N-acetyllactosaminide beta-1,3-N-acetylglucosaminyltransferase 3-like [Callorhinchus milii]|uniref:N-acetyllactosaminide beta-1,3-N-acetylglucosaminyltransferase 3-like n=1 Tax=Callorhinchus milii TaxID=7868 RepID=UPI001C3FB03F|nr:N-acetyllactosaminide beta-1,3-N-acetylglucosaminyltransferase 3-like [Callorhinchus milii]XP_042198608.1 N-acetyllactosaminide beta-1,3-N-acetylglucosaminyltransferase 3-like [Callorhinchus milii]XP_042198609.1 N-acetyllactosaminide beta-1,3-N-acetylglucosaminyltransferase 3-like [Callorhinchus milii]XP_042198610.1 N-acetyllactosaminide beta-1,3-N-acetylglucosaminyltransferase 3-like [Callorhinchus milii]XP_042198611.1 N-acetyllactosaminide beta-1,3-N-acetylglucosaminyltransferase 3-like [C
MKKLYKTLFEMILLMMVGSFGILFLLCSPKESATHSHVQKAALRRVLLPKSTVTKAKITKTGSVCKVNASVLQLPGFSEQLAHIQDYLKYRHCRAFELLRNLPDKCREEVFLLLVVKSNLFNYNQREMVRKTWGKEREIQGVRIRRIFIVAQTPNLQERGKANQLLEIENKEHQDILQWDFLDSFFNLTLKQYLFLQWMDDYCPSAQFIFNGDDDVFANTDNMVEFLLSSGSGQKHLYVGYLIYGGGPIREKWSKYFIPEIVTTSKSYPSYVAGGGILMSYFTSKAIYKASQTLELYPIDDVFFGMCLEKAGLSPKSHMGFRTAGVRDPSSNRISFDPCFYRELLLVHRFCPYELLLMWKAVHDPNLKCSLSQDTPT